MSSSFTAICLHSSVWLLFVWAFILSPLMFSEVSRVPRSISMSWVFLRSDKQEESRLERLGSLSCFSLTSCGCCAGESVCACALVTLRKQSLAQERSLKKKNPATQVNLLKHFCLKLPTSPSPIKTHAHIWRFKERRKWRNASSTMQKWVDLTWSNMTNHQGLKLLINVSKLLNMQG